MTDTTPPSPIFVAVGHFGLRIVSRDGVEWTDARLGKEGETFRAVMIGNGCIAAVGSFGGSNIFGSSRDGKAWKVEVKDAGYVNYLRGLGFGNKMFLGLGGDPGSVGDSKPFVVTSADGVAWSAVKTVSGKNMLRRIAYGNERFVAVGDRGRRAMSKDGFQWQDTPDVKAVDTLIDVVFGNGVFVGVGLHGLRMMSEDGLTWSHRELGEEGEHINSVLWTGKQFVAIGQGATYTSDDGRTWKRTVNQNAPLTAAFGNGNYVGSNWKGLLLHSRDAVEWKQVHKCDHHVEAVAFGMVG